MVDAEEQLDSAPFEQDEQQEENQRIIDPLGSTLRAEFDEAARERTEYEQGWLMDLRQYKGIYEPEIEAKIPANKSRTNIRLTRTKVKTMDARLSDMLFPAGGDRNWSIEPTPVPEIDPMQKQQLVQQVQMAIAQQQAELQAMGQDLPPEMLQGPSDEEIEIMVKELAEKASDKMAEEIDDQLVEGKYQHHVRMVLHSGHLFGTGVLKGPLVETRQFKRWRQGKEGYEMFEKPVKRPYFSHTSIWNVFPDLTATELDDCDFIWERHIMPRHKVRKLARRKGFDKEKILAHLKAMPAGDAAYMNFETELKHINDKNAPVGDRKKKYELLERWGYLTGQELADCGCEIPEEMLDMDIECNVWLLGNYVIKAVLNPTEQQQRPYHFYYFEKDETSIFGISVPSIIRDPAANFNALIRAAIDNSAATAGPIGEVNLDLLDDSEDPTDIHAFRMFLRHGQGEEARHPAVRFLQVPNHVQSTLKLADTMKQMIDESSAIPSYMHGEQDNGVGRTVGGLSMLMGAANITVKDVVKNFDDGITKPFMGGMYHWNMQFNDREDIKGDYEVKALGSTSLIAKEIRAQSLDQFSASVKNPIDAPWIKNGALLRKRAAAHDIEEDVIKTDDEFRDEMMTGGDVVDGTPNPPPVM